MASTKTAKRLGAIILTLAMILSLMPLAGISLSARADDNTEETNGQPVTPLDEPIPVAPGWYIRFWVGDVSDPELEPYVTVPAAAVPDDMHGIDEADEPANPTKADQWFVGWFILDNNGEYADSGLLGFIPDMLYIEDEEAPGVYYCDLYAMFADKDQYAVTFWIPADEGDPLSHDVFTDWKIVYDGDVLTPADLPTMHDAEHGKRFVGWTEDINTDRLYVPGTPVTRNIKLYAVYGDQLRVEYYNYDDHGVLVREETKLVSAEDNIPAPSYVVNGSIEHSFNHTWFVFTYEDGDAFDLDAALLDADPSDAVAEAALTTLPVNKHTVVVPNLGTYHLVTFHTNGADTPAEGIPSQLVLDGGLATPPANPTKSGYVFLGWFTESTFENLYNFSTPVEGDVHLYAKWTQAEKSYTIVYWREKPDALSAVGTATRYSGQGSWANLQNLVDPGTDTSNYEIVGSVPVPAESATVGNNNTTDTPERRAEASFVAANSTRRHVTVNDHDDTKTTLAAGQTIAVTCTPEGDSIVNIFYRLNVYEIQFELNKTAAGTNAQMTANSSTINNAAGVDYYIYAKFGQNISAQYPITPTATSVTNDTNNVFDGWRVNGVQNAAYWKIPFPTLSGDLFDSVKNSTATPPTVTLNAAWTGENRNRFIVHYMLQDNSGITPQTPASNKLLKLGSTVSYDATGAGYFAGYAEREALRLSVANLRRDDPDIYPRDTNARLVYGTDNTNTRQYNATTGFGAIYVPEEDAIQIDIPGYVIAGTAYFEGIVPGGTAGQTAGTYWPLAVPGNPYLAANRWFGSYAENTAGVFNYDNQIHVYVYYNKVPFNLSVSYNNPAKSNLTGAPVYSGADLSTYLYPGTRNGFSFDGWFTDAAFTNPFDEDHPTMPSSDLNLFARWEPLNEPGTYLVTYFRELGDATTIWSESVTEGESITLLDPTDTTEVLTGAPAIPQGTDGFLGWYWYFNGVPIPYNNNHPVTANTYLYAKYSYKGVTVTFVNPGGTDETREVPFKKSWNGEHVSLPEPPSLPEHSDHFYFAGWTYAPNTGTGTNGYYIAEHTIDVPRFYGNEILLLTNPDLHIVEDNGSYSLTLYPIFLPVSHTITYSFGLPGGSTAEYVCYARHGASTPPFTPPTTSGWYFLGWDTPVAEMVMSDATYTAQWGKIEIPDVIWTDTELNPGANDTKNLEVKMKYSDESIDMEDLLIEIVGYDDDGQVITGLDLDEFFTLGTITTSKVASPITGGGSLQDFVGGGGLGGLAFTFDTVTYTIPLTPKDKAYGHTFTLHISAKTTGAVYYSIGSVNQANSPITTLVVGDVPTYTVKYNGNGNDSDGDDEADAPVDPDNPYYVGSEATVMGQGDLVKGHYAFVGWNTERDGSGTSFEPDGALVIAAAMADDKNIITLYAQWVEVFTVTYHGNGNDDGTEPVDSNEYYEDDTVTVLGKGSLVKTNYTFKGWATSPSGAAVYTYDSTSGFSPADFTIDEDTDLYAVWEENAKYTVTYYGNGNTGGDAPLDANEYYEDDTVTVLGQNTLTREHYSFLGWAFAADAETPDYEEDDTFSITGDTTLYAVWERNKYTVDFVTNCDIVVDSQKVFSGETAEEPDESEMVWPGYEFKGWYLDNDAYAESDIAYDFYTPVTHDITLYAKWVEIPGSVVIPDLEWSTDNELNLSHSDSTKTLVVTMVYGDIEDDPAKSIALLPGVSIWGYDDANGEAPVRVDSSQEDLQKYFTLGTVTVSKGGVPIITFEDLDNLDALLEYLLALDNFTFDTVTYEIQLQPTVEAYGKHFDFRFSGWVNNLDGFEIWRVDSTNSPEVDDEPTRLTVGMPTYTVTYHANGGSGSVPTDASSPYNYGKSVTVLDKGGLSRTDYTFLGWATTATGAVVYAPDATFNIKADTDLYAVWRYDGGGNPPPEIIEDPDTPLPDSPFIDDHFAYVIGYPEGDVRPNNNITRAEVATVFFRLLTDEIRTANWTKVNPFTDVSAKSWYNNAISVMSKMGIVNGYEDGSFRPDDTITRAELAAIAARFSEMMGNTGSGDTSFSDISGHWAEEYIKAAAEIGWVRGYEDGSYRPNQPITRAEFMTLVNRMLERMPKGLEDVERDWTKIWIDNANQTVWYYIAVQEATNSHYYEYYKIYVEKGAEGTVYKDEDGRYFKYEIVDGFKRETWTTPMENRDWAAFEKSWSEAN